MYINNLKKKIIQKGFKGLDRHEILEYLLFYLTRRNSEYNKKLSLELLRRYKSIYKLIKAPSYKHIRSSILTEDLFIFFKIIDGLIENEILYKELNKNIKLVSTKNSYEYLKYSIAHYEKEVFKVLFLNTQYELIKEEILFTGTIDKSNIYLREIIKKVIYYNAKAIIISHNHPSGSISPSKSDIDITDNIKDMLSKIDVLLLDHIIVSYKGYYSFVEGGLL